MIMNAKPCPNLPLPAPPVNILLPLPLTPTPTKSSFNISDSTSKPPAVRRRSSTFSAITNWALAVQPGSPSPNSPRRSPSGSPGSGFAARRPSFSRRRPSISHNRARSGSSSFLHLIDTPGRKTSEKQSEFNLTSLGYTSVFVHLPNTPTTPSPHRTGAREPAPHPPRTPSAPPKGLKRFRSLGMLKRGKSANVAVPPVPSLPIPTTPTTTVRPSHRRSRSGSISPSSPLRSRPTMPKSKSAHSKSKSISTSTPSKKSFKKSTGADVPAVPPLPPTLASELLLMQFMDGGSLESNAKRVMEKRAKEAAPAGSSAVDPVPVGTVFRDENGQIWLDEDEALEYKALLTPASPDSPSKDWVTFEKGSPEVSRVASTATLAGGEEREERRGSVTSMSSSLSLSNVVIPADGSAYAMHLLRAPSASTSSTSTDSVLAAGNKRTRRRPAPLKLHSSSSIPTQNRLGAADENENVFEDSFAPVQSRRRSSSGRVSAPAGRMTFEHGSVRDADGDVVMALGEDGPAVAPKEKVKTMKKMPSRLDLVKNRAKALFGGLGQ